MQIGMGVPKPYPSPRSEPRFPMEVGVKISGHLDLPGVETTFTENVSACGARVLSNRRWRANDRISVATLTGDFRSVGRVAYCESVRGAGYAVGIEFVEKSGVWVVARAPLS
jgi:hypothetical protein